MGTVQLDRNNDRFDIIERTVAEKVLQIERETCFNLASELKQFEKFKRIDSYSKRD